MPNFQARESGPATILLLDTGNEWGGGTNSMFELLKRLDRRRFAVTCCFYKDYRKGRDGRLLSAELAELGIPMTLLPPVKQPRWAKVAKELVRAVLPFWPRLKKSAVLAIDLRWRVQPRVAALLAVLRQGRFDLLYLNNQPSSNLEGYLAAEQAGLPVVQHCRIEPQLLPAEAAVVNRVATRIICVSQGVADVLAAQQVEKRRLHVVYNAIDCAQTLPPPTPLEPASAGLVIGTVGQLVARKNVAHLLQAVALLKAGGLTIDCLVLGEGPQHAALVAEAAALGIAGQVRFAGFQAAPLAWVQAMDICVLCSQKEGLPRVLLEAMLAGKPVIGSQVTGTRELIVHEETGLLYELGDIKALAAAVRRLALDPALRARMGAAGRRRVAAQFSIEAYVAGAAAVLDEALQ